MSLRVAWLPSTAAADPELVGRLTVLVNHAYRVGEDGLWSEDVERTTPAEVADHVRAEQMVGAFVDDDLVGAVRVQRLDATTGELGMLVTADHVRGVGAGRELVRFAEQWARSEGLRSMELEILSPRDGEHPSKELLRTWYGRMGYRVVRTGSFEEQHPRLAPHLAVACVFTVFRKSLAGAGDARG